MQLVSYAFLNSNQADQKFQFYQQLHRDWFPETPKQKAAWNKIDQGVPRAETEKNFELLKGLYKTSVSPLSYNFNDVLREMPGKYKASKTIVLGGNSNVSYRHKGLRRCLDGWETIDPVFLRRD